MQTTRGNLDESNRFGPRAVVVELVQDTYGSTEGPVLERINGVLLNIIESTTAHVVVDLSKAHYFGARLIGVLTTAYRMLCDRRRRLLLCGMTPYCHRVISLLQLQKVFELYPTRGNALVELSKTASKANDGKSDMWMTIETDEFDWDRKRYWRVRYFGDGVPLYYEFLPRN